MGGDRDPRGDRPHGDGGLEPHAVAGDDLRPLVPHRHTGDRGGVKMLAYPRADVLEQLDLVGRGLADAENRDELVDEWIGRTARQRPEAAARHAVCGRARGDVEAERAEASALHMLRDDVSRDAVGRRQRLREIPPRAHDRRRGLHQARQALQVGQRDRRPSSSPVHFGAQQARTRDALEIAGGARERDHLSEIALRRVDVAGGKVNERGHRGDRRPRAGVTCGCVCRDLGDKGHRAVEIAEADREARGEEPAANAGRLHVGRRRQHRFSTRVLAAPVRAARDGQRRGRDPLRVREPAGRRQRRAKHAVGFVETACVDPGFAAQDREVDERPLLTGAERVVVTVLDHGLRVARPTAPQERSRQDQRAPGRIVPGGAARQAADHLPQLANSWRVKSAPDIGNRVGHPSAKRHQLAGRRPRAWDRRGFEVFLERFVAAIDRGRLGDPKRLRSPHLPRRRPQRSPSGPQQLNEPSGQTARSFGRLPDGLLETAADALWPNRRDQAIGLETTDGDPAHRSTLVLADQQEHVRHRIPDRGGQQRRPRTLARGFGDDEQASTAPQLRMRRVEQSRRHRHKAFRSRHPCQFTGSHTFARSRRSPHHRHMRTGAAGLKHFRQGRDDGLFDNLQPTILNPQSASRPLFAVGVATARIGKPDPTAIAIEPDGIRQERPRRQAARVQPPRRPSVQRPGLLTHSRRAASPRFEARRVADQAEVDQGRDRTMTQRAQRVAARDPSKLLRHAAGAADDQRDARAGREIERASVLVKCKSIRDKLHA